MTLPIKMRSWLFAPGDSERSSALPAMPANASSSTDRSA